MSDEVLVHISTAATRQNDEVFRSLASAYIDFQPHSTDREGPLWKRARMIQTAERQPKQPSTGAKTNAIGAAANSAAPTASKDAYGSFSSNIPSEGHYLEEDESGRPISRLAQLDRSYLSWRRLATPKSSFAHSEAELRTVPDGLGSDNGFIEDSQTALQALQSQLQDTYSAASADTSEDNSGEGDLAKSRSHLANSTSMIRFQGSETIEGNQLPAPLDENALKDLNVSLSHKPTDLPTASSPGSRDRLEVVTDETNFSELQIDAFPPPPITSVGRPRVLPSQVTTHLAAIKAKNSTRFRPLEVRRDLEHDERGFWRIDCSRWSLNAQRDFWLSLCEHVCNGRVGWATTLHRETGVHAEPGLIRLYCWGEVVEHMWLLVWLCSKGKASGTESKWIDASGIAVIEMA
ncbi:hypothetical protein E8E12_011514 [Didymella heteroderae]|uniref:Uncharacterized protein n=1 Tax=Didymella heteroderae TaxID=1769908 RepID=A0A9P5C637_9PLEO|nr:hypothetical protein E8E12_011514 [Didymella heteroderae]